MRYLPLLFAFAGLVFSVVPAVAQPHRHGHWHPRPSVGVYLGGFGGYYGPPPVPFAPYPRYAPYYYPPVAYPQVAVQVVEPPVRTLVEVPPTETLLMAPPARSNSLALPSNPEPQVSETIRLVNPAENGVTISYSFGNRILSLPYGQEKVFHGPGPTTVAFNRGRNLGERRLTLGGGTYEFRHLGDQGWELLPVNTRAPLSSGATEPPPQPLPPAAAPDVVIPPRVPQPDSISNRALPPLPVP